jgi:hypothetical protein
MNLSFFEQVEAEWMYRLETGAPRHVQANLGMRATRLGGGVVLGMRRDSTQYWNKALGFGFDAPVTIDLVAGICEFYRSIGSSLAVLQFAPSVLPREWDEIRTSCQLVPGGSWVKMVHNLASIDSPQTELKVREVETRDAWRWASALLRGFGMPEEGLLDMFVSAVGQPGFRCYAAWDGDEVVAVGNLFIQDGVAAMWGATTLLPHQRRGGQSALLAARLLAAKAADCRVVVAETGTEAPGERNPSLHNLRKAGFATLYERPNWIWRPRSPGPE